MHELRPAARSTPLRRAASLGLALLVSLPGAGLAQVPGGPAQNVLAGARVFGSSGCPSCHAVRGVGGTVGPDLALIEGRKSYYQFAAAIWNHLPQMSAAMDSMGLSPVRLRPWEAGDLVAFLFWLDYFESPGDPAAGAFLFSRKQCVSCHQVKGVGGVIGPNLDFLGQYGSPIQVAAALWNHGANMESAMRARGIERPSFSARELTDLISYLRSEASDRPPGDLYVLPGRPEAGRDLFRERRCRDCHSVGGSGGGRAPDLANRNIRNLMELAAAMWNKAPTMTRVMRETGIEVPRLTATDMADLVAYLSSVRYLAEEGSPARGRALIGSKGCLGCHTLGGSGARGARAGAVELTAVGGYASRSGVVAALWNHAAFLGRGGGGDRSPSRFTAREMANLIAFFESLETTR